MSLPLHNGALAVLEMQFPGKDNARSEWLCVHECVRACLHAFACVYLRSYVRACVSCVCVQGARVGMGREDGQVVCVHLCLSSSGREKERIEMEMRKEKSGWGEQIAGVKKTLGVGRVGAYGAGFTDFLRCSENGDK